MLTRCILAIAVFATLASLPVASGQDAEAPMDEYQAAHADYQATIKQVEALRDEFEAADEDRRKQIEAELVKLVETMQDKVERWDRRGPGGLRSETRKLTRRLPICWCRWLATMPSAVDP